MRRWVAKARKRIRAFPGALERRARRTLPIWWPWMLLLSLALSGWLGWVNPAIPGRELLAGVQAALAGIAMPLLILAAEWGFKADPLPLGRAVAEMIHARDRIGYALLGLFALLILPEEGLRLGQAAVLLTVLMTGHAVWRLLRADAEDLEVRAARILEREVRKYAVSDPDRSLRRLRRLADALRKAMHDMDPMAIRARLMAFARAMRSAVPLLRSEKLKIPPALWLDDSLQDLTRTAVERRIHEHMPDLLAQILEIPREMASEAIRSKDKGALHMALEGLRFVFLGAMDETAELLLYGLPPLLRESRERYGRDDPLTQELEFERAFLIALALRERKRVAFEELLKTYSFASDPAPDLRWWWRLQAAEIALIGDSEDFQEWHKVMRDNRPYAGIANPCLFLSLCYDLARAAIQVYDEGGKVNSPLHHFMLSLVDPNYLPELSEVLCRAILQAERDWNCPLMDNICKENPSLWHRLEEFRGGMR